MTETTAGTTSSALIEESSNAPAAVVSSRPDIAGIAIIGAALIVGLPGAIVLSRFLTVIVLSLILGH